MVMYKTLRLILPQQTYYQADCLPEMKKNNTYTIRLILDNKSADIQYAWCGCAAYGQWSNWKL